jgi:hypothetical protein
MLFWLQQSTLEDSWREGVEVEWRWIVRDGVYVGYYVTQAMNTNVIYN